MSAYEEDEDRYGPFGDGVVQVRIAGAGKRTYAYEVPRGVDVGEGTWVVLPGNVVSEEGGFGLVKSFGRDGYDGPLKMIVRVMDSEPSEFMVRMSVVKTREGAAKVYDEAVAAGVRGDELTDVAVTGEQRLRSRGIL